MESSPHAYRTVDTPALLIERSVMERNLAEMQQAADAHGVSLRPHTKTHKMPALARRQVERGARGIAVAKLGEAEVMARRGVDEIQIANLVVGEEKVLRLLALHRTVKSLSCTVDSAAGAQGIDRVFAAQDRTMEVFVEVNCGHNRCGLSDFEEILALCRFVEGRAGLSLRGIMTHAGQVYAAADLEEVRRTGEHEGQIMVRLAEYLRESGIAISEVSAGSTPTAPHCAKVRGVTEIRPGNYIFHDLIQVALGAATLEQCALTVLSTVISTPTSTRAIVDAGSKALALDRGFRADQPMPGFGQIAGRSAVIGRLSEEHGIINHDGTAFTVGERVRLIPNHACVVSNLFDTAYLVDNGEIVETLDIEARGKIT